MKVNKQLILIVEDLRRRGVSRSEIADIVSGSFYKEYGYQKMSVELSKDGFNIELPNDQMKSILLMKLLSDLSEVLISGSDTQRKCLSYASVFVNQEKIDRIRYFLEKESIHND